MARKKYLTQKVTVAGANFPFQKDAYCRHLKENKVQ